MGAEEPAAFRVVGPVAVVRSGKAERYVYRNGIIVADDIDEDNAKHLQDVGLIEPFELPEGAPEPEPTFSQEDVDAAVKAATEALTAELEQAKKDAADAAAERDAAKAELDKSKTPAPKAPASKQS